MIDFQALANIEGAKMDKGEILKNVESALLNFAKNKNEKNGLCVFLLTVEGEEKIPVFGLFKIGPNKNLIWIENYNFQDFFTQAILSLAENIAQKIQVKALINVFGKKFFPEIEKALSNNIEPAQTIMMWEEGENLRLTLNEKGQYRADIILKDIL